MMKSLVGLLLYGAQHNKSKPISVLERLFRKALASLAWIQVVTAIGCCHACQRKCSVQVLV
ncbi:hypothetical protein ALQ84_200139 [Pseudomonas caricapapayae]|uniref:Uncharacterized protein n=1 Tax=Pseudomonas caricapapayae TaxID=46678 RepID=A0A3M3BAV3_9PSED|nr:hypothetical protein F4W67_29625 [Pseudomonas caricapapayae]RMM09840.1 hypothetical protein ALQ84_200139 [Pseudomonas caricapapayae]